MIQGAKSIEEIRLSIADVPWDHLAHAYHGAWDVPAQLEAFLDTDSSQETLDKAVDWMWASILHQGSIYSASTPALWILIDIISARTDHPAAAPILFAIQTITDGLLFRSDDSQPIEPIRQNAPGEPVYQVWIQKALVMSEDDTEENEEYFEACRVTHGQLQALVRHAIPVISHCLKHSDTDTRTAAVAAGLGAVQVVPDDAKSLFGLIDIVGDSNYDTGTWISVAMVFGALGHDVSKFLGSSDRRVRLSAAMSIGTQGDPRSVTELASAISEPEWLEAEFPNGAAHLDMHLRFHVLGALLDRTDPDATDSVVVNAICTLIDKRSGSWTVDDEWGRVLHWAFQDRLTKLPRDLPPARLPDSLTSTQAAILRTLCLKDELWDPKNGNASLAYKRIQLPYDRQVLCVLAR